MKTLVKVIEQSKQIPIVMKHIQAKKHLQTGQAYQKSLTDTNKPWVDRQRNTLDG